MENRSNFIALRHLAAALAALLILGFAAAALWPSQSPLVPMFPRRGDTLVRQLDEAMGATVEPLDIATARSLGLAPGTRGVVVTSLANGGPAARAGVRTGDVVVAVDEPVASVKDLAAGLRKNNHILTVTLNRRGQSVTVPLTIDSRSGAPALFGKE